MCPKHKHEVYPPTVKICEASVFQLEEKLDQLDLIEVKSGNKIEVLST